MKLRTSTSAALYERAKVGDLRAGRDLIAACREGMLVPDWEEATPPTEKTVQTHLKRRKEWSGRR